MQLIKGTLDLIVLKTLSWEPMHGFAIAAWIEQQFGGELVLEEGGALPVTATDGGARLDCR